MPVMNTVISGGGGSGVITSLNVTPSTSAQTITATGAISGYSPVNVSAVTSSIDANIQAGNIKNGISILGVMGNYGGTPSVTKYGVDIDGVLGSVNASGEMQGPICPSNTTITFTGIKAINSPYIWNAKFTWVQNVVSVVFPDLEEVSNTSSMQGCFEYASDLVSAYFPKLKTIGQANSVRYMFTGTPGTTVYFRYEKYGVANFTASAFAATAAVWDQVDYTEAALPSISDVVVGDTCHLTTDDHYYQVQDVGGGTLGWVDITR